MQLSYWSWRLNNKRGVLNRCDAPEQLKQGVMDGDSRYVVFVSKTAGEYLHFYYKPTGINEWRIAVSVPESVVFESADTIGRILNLFLVFELICFIVYFLWMACYVRKVTGEKQRRLETLNYIYDVWVFRAILNRNFPFLSKKTMVRW